MKASSPITLILAAVDGERPSTESIEAFLREARECNAMVTLMDATPNGCDLWPSVDFHIIRCPTSTFVPALWAIGLHQSQGNWVALSTTAMVPERGWLRSLIETSRHTGASAVGTAIRPSENLCPIDRAVYLCRYASYLQPRVGASPAGESVLYRSALLATVEPIWRQEFWEAEVHQELKRGDARFHVELRPGVFYSGGAQWRPLLLRRFIHAKRYGATRPLGRLGRLRVLGTPLVPFLLAWRAFQSLKRSGLSMRQFTLGVWMRLLLLNSVWAVGEAVGVVQRWRQPYRQPSANGHQANPLPEPG